MPMAYERKLMKHGQTALVVTIPPAWLKYYGLKHGDTVLMVADGDILIRPSNKPGSQPNDGK